MKLPWNIQKDPFIRLMDLPGECLSFTLPGSDIRYAVTGDYADRARNHCACICSENLVLYFRSLEEGRSPSPVRMTRQEREAAKLSKALYRDALFERIHSALGNGPVFSIKKEALRLLEENGIRAEAFRIRPRDREGIIQALDGGIPLALLLRISPFNWHWVLAVGWRLCKDGTFYLEVADSWNPRSDRFLEVKGAFFPAILTVTGFRKK